MQAYHYIEPELIARICSISQAIGEILCEKGSSLFLPDSFFNPVNSAKVEQIFKALQDLRQNILEAIQQYELKQSADLRTMDMRNVSLRTVLNLVLVDYAILLEKPARVKAICELAQKWVFRREAEFKKGLEQGQKNQNEERKVKKEEGTSDENQKKEASFWKWMEFSKGSAKNQRREHQYGFSARS